MDSATPVRIHPRTRLPAKCKSFLSGASKHPEAVRFRTNRRILGNSVPNLALDDEYKPWSTYSWVPRDFGEIRPFSNIVQAEQRHVDALLELCAHYEVTPPPNRCHSDVPRYISVREACEHAIEGEIANAALCDRVLQSTSRTDIVGVYRALQSASTDRHLPAFRRCAARG